MSRRHKVFISYHHENDQNYKNIFELKFGNANDVIIPGGVKMGDIDPSLKTETIRQKIRDEYLRDTSVTVVLIGTKTWQRKHVDWEISSSLRNTEKNQRSGLLGILLPSYKKAHNEKFDPHTLPPRLADNLDNRYAKLCWWSEDPQVVQDAIHDAYLAKNRIIPDNARDLFKKNRTSDYWTS